MRAAARLWCVTLSLVLSAGAARADPYDFKLYKLGSTFQGGTNYDVAANARYRVVMRQLAAAVTAVNRQACCGRSSPASRGGSAEVMARAGGMS